MNVTRRVLIKCDRKVYFIREREILFVEAAGNYVHVSMGPDTLLTRSSLNRLESMLSTDRFVRIHRSAIVNLDQICHLEPQPGGEYIVTLNGGKQLKASRRHVCELMKSIRGHVGEEQLLDPEASAATTIPIRTKASPQLVAKA